MYYYYRNFADCLSLHSRRFVSLTTLSLRTPSIRPGQIISIISCCAILHNLKTVLFKYSTSGVKNIKDEGVREVDIEELRSGDQSRNCWTRRILIARNALSELVYVNLKLIPTKQLEYIIFYFVFILGEENSGTRWVNGWILNKCQKNQFLV